ncbi:MAG: hypothetical protein WCT31_02275, partial [Candidatus Micrarchaeia archaeon]
MVTLKDIRTDPCEVRSQTIGSGRVGDKTFYLQQFKSAVEKAGSGKVIIPSHLSYPIDVFHSLLVREGILAENGNLIRAPEKDHAFDYGKHLEKLLRDGLWELRGRVISVRSDERTAYGIGVFKTNFIYVDEKNFENSFQSFLCAIGEILEAQFSRYANAVKARLNHPHGIGIQLMPLAGTETQTFTGANQIYPAISVAGHTILGQNKIRLTIGAGIGGGVGIGERVTIQRPEELCIYIENPYENRGVFDLDSGFNSSAALDWILLPDIGDSRKTAEFPFNEFLAISRALQRDFYFEAQMLSFEDQRWAVTQMAPHTWKDVAVPQGQLVFTSPQTVGSGLVTCHGVSQAIA